jgi:hypothetical protein
MLSLILPAVAVATAAPSSTIEIAPTVALVVSYLQPLLEVLITGAVGWLAATLKRKWHLDIDTSHRESLQASVKNAAGLLIQRGVDATQGKTIDIGSPMMAASIKYVQDSAGGALKHFGLGPEDIALKIAAALPQITTPPSTVPAAEKIALSAAI